jgi:hypothetical protein
VASKTIARDEDAEIKENEDYMVIECNNFDVRLMIKYLGIYVNGKLRLMRITSISNTAR